MWFYEARAELSLLAAYAALQIAMNVASGPYQAAIPDAVPATFRGRASAWMSAFQSSGNALGAVLAVVTRGGLVLAVLLAAVLIGTSGVTSATMKRWPQMRPENAAPLRITRPFAFLFFSRVLLFAGFYTLLGYMFFYTLAFIAPQAARARTIDGILILLFTAMGACGAALAAKPADRFDRRNVATAGGLAAVCALGIFVLGHSPVAAAAAIPLGGLGWGAFLVADWAIACKIIPSGAAAGAMAIWNLAVLLPQVLAPLAATALIGRLGRSEGAGVLAAFALAGVEMLGGLWLLRCLPADLTRE